MTHKCERQCWSCGSRNMEDKGDYAQCKACGATYNDIAPLGGPLVEPGMVVVRPGRDPLKIHATHPTRGVVRRAARARRKS